MSPLRVAVIGVGHLGKEHARILAGLSDTELVGVADTNRDQASAIAQRCGTQAYSDYKPLLEQVDAATIVVPTTYHFPIAAEFLRHGISILVEKPLAPSLEQAQALVELAELNNALLQVGHIERFNPAFEELQRCTMQPKFVECERLGGFSGRSADIGVVLDLMIHDLDLLLSLVRSPVESVSALGVSVFGGQEDVANARLAFSDGCVANVTASRASSTPSRRMSVWAPEGYASIDFSRRSLSLVQPSAELRQRGLDVRRMNPAELGRLKDELFGRHLEVETRDCNAGDQLGEPLGEPLGDPLTRELQDFVHCVRTGSSPRVDGAAGRDAIELAERILRSLRDHSWEGRAARPKSPRGPRQLPAPVGQLIPRAQGRSAA